MLKIEVETIESPAEILFYRFLWQHTSDQGYSHAQYNLGVCYHKGRRVAIDEREAERRLGFPQIKGILMLNATSVGAIITVKV